MDLVCEVQNIVKETIESSSDYVKENVATTDLNVDEIGQFPSLSDAYSSLNYFSMTFNRRKSDASIAEKISELENQMRECKLVFMGDDGKLLKFSHDVSNTVQTDVMREDVANVEHAQRSGLEESSNQSKSMRKVVDNVESNKMFSDLISL